MPKVKGNMWAKKSRYEMRHSCERKRMQFILNAVYRIMWPGDNSPVICRFIADPEGAKDQYTFFDLERGKRMLYHTIHSVPPDEKTRPNHIDVLANAQMYSIELPDWDKQHESGRYR